MSLHPDNSETQTLTQDAQQENDGNSFVAVNTYQNFSLIYDTFGSEDFCITMASHIISALDRHNIPRGTPIVDVACGTGVITTELARQGYPISGVDLSLDMLEKAKARTLKAGLDIPFSHQDMRYLQLQEPASCIICTHDSLDHLFQFEDLSLAFESFAKNLQPNGIWLFDMNCWSGIRHLNGRTIFVETDELSGAYHLLAVDRTLETSIVGFIKQPGGLYRRFDEQLYQRCYEDQEIRGLLEKNGLEVLQCLPIQHLEGDVFKQLWVAHKPGIEIPDIF